MREQRLVNEMLEKERRIKELEEEIARVKGPRDDSSQNLSGYEEWILPEHVVPPKAQPMAAPAFRPSGLPPPGAAGPRSPGGSALWHDISTPRLTKTIMEQFDEFYSPGQQQFHTPQSHQVSPHHGDDEARDLLNLGYHSVPEAPQFPSQYFPKTASVLHSINPQVPILNLGNLGTGAVGATGSAPFGSKLGPPPNLGQNQDALIAAQLASRGKEAEYITIQGDIPTAPQFKTWKRILIQQVSAAAGPYFDRAHEWMEAIEKHSFEELSNPYPFASLDGKLAAALLRLFKGPLGRKLDLKTEELTKKGGILRGRQMAKMIYEELEPEVETLGVQAQRNASAIQCPHIDQFESYLISLDNIVNISSSDFTDTVLEHLLLPQMEKFSSAFNLDLAEYERSSRAVSKNYRFLRQRAEGYIERTKRKKINNEIASAYSASGFGKHKSPPPPPSALMVIPPGGKAGQKGKPGGKAKAPAKGGAQTRQNSPVPSRSTKPCFGFAKGSCDKGDRCEWSHDPEIIAAHKAKPNPRKGGSPPGSPKGSPRNKTRKPLTPRSRDELCKSFMESGQCKYGDKCAFKHGHDAIVVKGMICLPLDPACLSLPGPKPGQSIDKRGPERSRNLSGEVDKKDTKSLKVHFRLMGKPKGGRHSSLTRRGASSKVFVETRQYILQPTEWNWRNYYGNEVRMMPTGVAVHDPNYRHIPERKPTAENIRMQLAGVIHDAQV